MGGFGYSDYESAVRFQEFKIAEKNEKFPFCMKICIWGFSGMLITNLLLDFENSKCWCHSGNVQTSYCNKIGFRGEA